MSTIKVNKIENTSTADGGVAIDVDGHVTIDGQQMPTAGALSSRRININGAMQIAQRSTSVTGLSASNAVQTVDRMYIRINSAGTFTVSQSTDAPEGFSNSLKWECTTADSSPGANDFAYLAHRMEGQDLQHLKKGTSGAEKTTVSFWVKSSETGTYAFRIVDSDNSRQVGLNYTIDTADTWEFKTLTFPGDTSGALDNDNGNSLSLFWWLVVGSNRTSGAVPTAWEATATVDEAAGMTANIANTISSNFYITGLQFEVGSKSTPFEHRSYGDELARCQRYFYKIAGNTTDQTALGIGYVFNETNGAEQIRLPILFPVTMRSDPAATGAEVLFLHSASNDITVNSFQSLDESIYGAAFNLDLDSSTLALRDAGMCRLDNTQSAHLSFNAEL